ncbi:HNH endonuclease [Bdellovibrio sp. GT3]|uniref:HNH endonuclease n=1 Tax=Bdellovibrio sp. GT3 TaxID=3136282 RepID=UPI0030F2F019
MNSTNVKSMTDHQLIERVDFLVRRERELAECLIWHLQEIQERKLYIQMGFVSLFECLVKRFKYSEATAYSRISALKIISTIPEAAEALCSGEVNVTNLTLVQSSIRKQEKATGESVSIEQKTQYLNSIKSKTTQEAKQILAEINPIQELPTDKIQYLDKDHAQLQVTVEKSVLAKFEKLKALISHENISPNYNDLLHLALDAATEKIEKRKGIHTPIKKDLIKNNLTSKDRSSKISFARNDRHCKSSTQSFAIKNSRYISRYVKRAILHRSQGQCEHIHPDGKRCHSRFQLQFDHVHAFSKGGGSDFGNIQTLCRVHNAYKATT